MGKLEDITVAQLDLLISGLDCVIHRYDDLIAGVLRSGWRCQISTLDRSRKVIGYGEVPSRAICEALRVGIEMGLVVNLPALGKAFADGFFEDVSGLGGA